MIGEALQCVVRDLNHHLPGAVPGGRHKLATLMALTDQETQAARGAANTVALTLTALEEEKNFMDGAAAARGAPSLARSSEQIFLNLHVLFAANHADHKRALDALSSVIGYIKAKPVFDARNTTRFPPGLQRLTFAMERLDYSALSNLWSYLGARYLPSACYTIRVVGVGRRQVEAVVPAIAETEVVA